MYDNICFDMIFGKTGSFVSVRLLHCCCTCEGNLVTYRYFMKQKCGVESDSSVVLSILSSCISKKAKSGWKVKIRSDYNTARV